MFKELKTTAWEREEKFLMISRDELLSGWYRLAKQS
jgi:hypothetical protein